MGVCEFKLLYFNVASLLIFGQEIERTHSKIFIFDFHVSHHHTSSSSSMTLRSNPINEFTDARSNFVKCCIFIIKYLHPISVFLVPSAKSSKSFSSIVFISGAKLSGLAGYLTLLEFFPLSMPIPFFKFSIGFPLLGSKNMSELLELLTQGAPPAFSAGGVTPKPNSFMPEPILGTLKKSYFGGSFFSKFKRVDSTFLTKSRSISLK